MANRVALQFTDEGVGRDDVRPRFDALLAEVRRRAEMSEPPVVAVADLTRLFRCRRDRDRIDELLAAGSVDVFSASESINTSEPSGPDRYRQVADLVMLAYEGGALTGTCGQIVNRYVDDVLATWLLTRDVPEDELNGPLADVRSRLLALAARAGTPELSTLLAPYEEIAQVHEPAELPLEVRAFAVVGVRNSELETLHLAGHIEQWDWRVITQAAAHALAALQDAPGEVASPDDDPFAGLVDDFPTAAAAFSAISRCTLGGEETWEAPQRTELPEPPAGDGTLDLTPEGFEVQHATDERISDRMADIVAARCDDQLPLAAPSLKHLSRNSRKLWRIVDCALAHSAPVATANLMIEPGRVRRADAAGYNDTDLAWCGLGDITPAAAMRSVGRNDPCPCGSGKKYKRCCGR